MSSSGSSSGSRASRGAGSSGGPSGTKRTPVTPCLGDGLVVRRLVIRSRDVVFFKGVIEASEGLAGGVAEHGAAPTVAAPAPRAPELDAVLGELCVELGAVRVDS